MTNVTGVIEGGAVIAPFALGFSIRARAELTSVILGAVVFVLAAYQILFSQPQTKK